MPTSIEWTDETWNPVTGCDRISPGCANCYIERTMPFRVEGRRFDKHGKMGIRLHPDRLDKPLHWRKPRRVFVNSLADLFHVDVPDDFVAKVYAVMVAASDVHTFQTLTKRPQRMARLLSSEDFQLAVQREVWALGTHMFAGFVRPNHWWGCSIESDPYTWRANHLRATQAAVRFISAEPLLGPLPSLDLTDIDWVIAGGESGPGARPMDPAWAADLVERCRNAGVAVFVKQLGSRWGRTHHDIDTFPPELQVREMPVPSAAASGTLAP